MADEVPPTGTTASIDIGAVESDTNPIQEAPVPATSNDTTGVAEQRSLSATAVAELAVAQSTASDAQPLAPTDAATASQEAEFQLSSRDSERCRFISQTEAEVCTSMALACQ